MLQAGTGGNSGTGSGTGSGSADPGGSAPPPEKSATSSAPASLAKLRSCVICRRRKVRCDKLSPCSNCRRANITCVFPSNNDPGRPPRWARRLDRITNNAVTNNAASTAETSQAADPGAGQIMERLRNLESLVKDLSGQLEQATAVASSAAGGSSGVNSPGSSTHEREADHHTNTSSTTSTTGMQKQFGRLVLQDSSRSRYVSSGFWSRINDELEGLKMDTRSLAGVDSDSSEDGDSLGKTSSTQELERTPSERNAFLFRHNLGASPPDPCGFHPLPSQIPFLLNTYSENVNFIIQIVHIPTITKMMRELRGTHMSSLTPANDALMFSIYYAAVTSMEDDDVMTNFGSTKAELNFKYRLGFEHALARADFLNVPDIVLVQAFVIFLFLVRRHDSPRFVWMMTGLVIRMAQALGLHRDGSHFQSLSPFEVELRRRVWWAICMLDVRASEDQGTDFTITSGSFDTKLPMNVNDADLGPESKVAPPARHAVTDMTFALFSFETCDVTRQIMAPGVKEGAPSLEDQSLLLKNLYEKFERGYLQKSKETGNIAYWVGVTATRLVISKMTLFIYLPVLFSPPTQRFSDEIRNKLLVSAIEVAEYNHALNSEQTCRQWRWIYQTYTHWHAVVYILIDISRRRWSPLIERAWVALHSSWLIPAQPSKDKNLRFWVPLRRLMAKGRKHREAELERLRSDARAARELETDDRDIPVPASSGPFPAEKSEELFREHWRRLVALPVEPCRRAQTSETRERGASPPSIVVQGIDILQQKPSSVSNTGFEWAHLPNGSQVVGQGPSNTTSTPKSTTAMDVGPGFTPWLWADADPTVDVFAGVDVNMDVDSEVDWYNWLESAKDVDWSIGSNGAGGR